MLSLLACVCHGPHEVVAIFSWVQFVGESFLDLLYLYLHRGIADAVHRSAEKPHNCPSVVFATLGSVCICIISFRYVTH